MPKKRDDAMSYQVGIFLGADWSVPEIARHLGISRQAIYLRQSREGSKQVVEMAMAWTQIAISKHIEQRIQKAEEDFAEKKKRIRTKGYKLLEKTIDHGLKEEVEVPDGIHLRAAEIGIEREEGKALDRKAILERHEHVYRRELDGDDLDGVLNALATINELRIKALPPHVENES